MVVPSMCRLTHPGSGLCGEEEQPHNIGLSEPQRAEAEEGGQSVARVQRTQVGQTEEEDRPGLGVVEKGEQVEGWQEGQRQRGQAPSDRVAGMVLDERTNWLVRWGIAVTWTHPETMAKDGAEETEVSQREDHIGETEEGNRVDWCHQLQWLEQQIRGQVESWRGGDLRVPLWRNVERRISGGTSPTVGGHIPG